MATARSIPETATAIYALLEPLETDERQRVVASVLTLLGETQVPSPRPQMPPGDETPENHGDFGVKAKRWMQQNQITQNIIEEIFHDQGGALEIIASSVPGSGKREQTKNCYLLVGAKNYLESDNANFSESEVLALSKHLGCHDLKNHAKYRGDLGNSVAGSKASGFTLAAPGLREAATLIKKMSPSK